MNWRSFLSTSVRFWKTLSNLLDSLPVVAASILRNPASVIVLDTCAILDLFRSQHRLQSPPRLIEMALKAIDVSSIRPARLHVIVLEQVETEYKKNAPDELLALAKHFRTLFHTGTTLLPGSQAVIWQTGLSVIETALSAIPDSLISICARASHDVSCIARARFRLASG